MKLAPVGDLDNAQMRAFAVSCCWGLILSLCGCGESDDAGLSGVATPAGGNAGESASAGAGSGTGGAASAGASAGGSGGSAGGAGTTEPGAGGEAGTPAPGCPAPPTGSWQSSLVYYGDDGALEYAADDEQNRIVDFSYAGYHYGEVPLPVVEQAATVGPVDGDDTGQIQAALDEIAALEPDADGFRGALLLEPGTYEIAGTLHVNQSGVVLRGSGDGDDPEVDTILQAVGDDPHQRAVVVLGSGDSTPWDSAPGIDVSDAFVQVGSRSLNVEDASGFAVGDRVVVRHPSTQAWIDALDGGGVISDAPWAPGNIDIVYYRTLTAVDGSELTFDAPLFNHLDASLATASVDHVTASNVISESGVENLRIDIQTTGGEDENHAWDAISVMGAEHVWVTNVTALHFGKSAVYTVGALHVTVSDVGAYDPVAIRTGGRMYNFDTEARSQLVLFTQCDATGGRHNFISNGASSASGNVWHRCGSSGSDSEGHRQWSQALLFDATNEQGDGHAQFINRGDYGTSHGWGAAHSVIWNSSGIITVQKPPTAQNYAIFSTGTLDETGPFPGELGFVEQQTGTLAPESLYEAQLCDRLQRAH